MCADLHAYYKGVDKERVTAFMSDGHSDKLECGHYKDKSLCVELPCKFGEKNYVVPSRTHIPKPLKTKLLAIGIDDDGDIVYNPNEYPEGVFGVSGGILGKTVFLTKEEAERKLEVGE